MEIIAVTTKASPTCPTDKHSHINRINSPEDDARLNEAGVCKEDFIVFPVACEGNNRAKSRESNLLDYVISGEGTQLQDIVDILEEASHHVVALHHNQLNAQCCIMPCCLLCSQIEKPETQHPSRAGVIMRKGMANHDDIIHSACITTAIQA